MARKKVHPDTLDRQSYGGFMTFYMIPGRIWLWLSYIRAPKGKVFSTSRKARSPIYTFFISSCFWAFIGYSLYLGYFVE